MTRSTPSSKLTIYANAPVAAYSPLIFYQSQATSSADIVALQIDTTASSISCEITSDSSGVIGSPSKVLRALIDILDASSGDEVDRWLRFVEQKLEGDREYSDIVVAADELDDALRLRTYLVGKGLTAADLAVWGACKGTWHFDFTMRTPGYY